MPVLKALKRLPISNKQRYIRVILRGLVKYWLMSKRPISLVHTSSLFTVGNNSLYLYQVRLSMSASATWELTYHKNTSTLPLSMLQQVHSGIPFPDIEQFLKAQSRVSHNTESNTQTNTPTRVLLSSPLFPLPLIPFHKTLEKAACFRDSFFPTPIYSSIRFQFFSHPLLCLLVTTFSRSK